MDNEVFVRNRGLHVLESHTNGFELQNPDIGVLAHISQFAALKLGLEFQLHGHEVWRIIVLEPFPCIQSISVLVDVTAAAANRLEGDLTITSTCID